MDEYLFDLRGYLVIEGALSREHVDELNAAIDAVPDLPPGSWHGHVHVQEHHPKRGLNLQNVVEAGEPFERLIDHPSWIEACRRLVGEIDGLFIDESFVSVRGPGESINIHSGGAYGKIRTQYRYHNGAFHCGQINVLMALTDIGPGDGATMVIPASHKSEIEHPAMTGPYAELMGTSAEGVECAQEVHLNAGDALLFVDSLAHGSAERRNAGERRICVYRYGPAWGQSRFGYRPSAGLLDRLTTPRREIVQPVTPRMPELAGAAS